MAPSSNASADEFTRIRGDMPSSSQGNILTTSLARTATKVKRTLIDNAAPHFSAVSRFGISKIASFWNDPFHTLLNLPWSSFIFVFFSTYLLLYLAFAWIYWLQKECIIDPEGQRFSHAIWISSRVASTLGFDSLRPNPDCSFINFCVMMQVIASSLINFIMLGVVFARFSAPFKRASTVRFSKVAVINRHSSGFWALTLRVANLRKHQILQPSVRLVATAVDSITPSMYHHEQLVIDGLYKQLTNLELGFPAHITHVITPDSFLYNFSLLEMDTRMMEILVFVDGIDAMTSRFMSARVAYSTSDIYMNETFAPMNLEQRGKSVGLDFRDFDKTVPAIDSSLLSDGDGQDAGVVGSSEGGLWQLRHQTFKKLAERYAHLGSVPGHYSTGASDPGNGPHSALPAPVAVTIPEASQKDALLGPDSSPSHGGSGTVVAGVKGMSLSTSGMPFAVTRPAEQTAKDGGLVNLFPSFKAGPSPAPGGAWAQVHSEAHQNPVPGGGSGGGSAGTSNGESFVAMTTFQRHGGSTGTAWQASQPHSEGVSPSHAAGTSTAPHGPFTDGTTKAPLMQSGLYSLDEEHNHHEQAALPTSQKAK